MVIQLVEQSERLLGEAWSSSRVSCPSLNMLINSRCVILRDTPVICLPGNYYCLKFVGLGSILLAKRGGQWGGRKLTTLYAWKRCALSALVLQTLTNLSKMYYKEETHSKDMCFHACFPRSLIYLNTPHISVDL